MSKRWCWYTKVFSCLACGCSPSYLIQKSMLTWPCLVECVVAISCLHNFRQWFSLLRTPCFCGLLGHFCLSGLDYSIDHCTCDNSFLLLPVLVLTFVKYFCSVLTSNLLLLDTVSFCYLFMDSLIMKYDNSVVDTWILYVMV